MDLELILPTAYSCEGRCTSQGGPTVGYRVSSIGSSLTILLLGLSGKCPLQLLVLDSGREGYSPTVRLSALKHRAVGSRISALVGQPFSIGQTSISQGLLCKTRSLRPLLSATMPDMKNGLEVPVQIEAQTKGEPRARRRKRAPRACQLCHDRRVRCDSAWNDSGCTNCQLDGLRCVLRISKRAARYVMLTGVARVEYVNTDELNTRHQTLNLNPTQSGADEGTSSPAALLEEISEPLSPSVYSDASSSVRVESRIDANSFLRDPLLSRLEDMERRLISTLAKIRAISKAHLEEMEGHQMISRECSWAIELFQQAEGIPP